MQTKVAIEHIQLSSEVYLEWRYQQRIAIFTIQNPSKENIDVFALAVIQTLNEWPTDRPILVLYDLRRMLNSPYFRQQAARIARETPDRAGRAGILIDYFLFARVAQVLLKRLIIPKQQLIRQIFFDEEKALQWLREPLSTQ